MHQIRVRGSDRTDEKASLNLASVYLDIAAGWKVNSEKASDCNPTPERHKTTDLGRCQASVSGFSGLRSAFCFTSPWVRGWSVIPDQQRYSERLDKHRPWPEEPAQCFQHSLGRRSPGACQQWKLQFTPSLVWMRKKDKKKTRLKGWAHKAPENTLMWRCSAPVNMTLLSVE